MHRESYPVLVACLEEVKEKFWDGTSDQKKKAEKADEILSSIYSIKFALTLAILCDIYSIYSQIAVLLQKVSTLPHIRYDQFVELIEEYKEMLSYVDISVCPCSTFRDIEAGSFEIKEEDKEEAALVCSWPHFHTDISTLKETGKIVHVIQGQLVTDPVKDTRVGRKHRASIKLLDQDAIIKQVEKRAADVVTHLSSRLEEKVYRGKDINVIKVTRVVLSANSLLQSALARGSITISNLTWRKFLQSSLEVDSTLLERVPEDELKVQYREYVRLLESLARNPVNRKLTDMELLELFLKPSDQHLYRGIEAVMSVMVRASLLISVESVVESWISTMEHHASQRRNLGEMLLHEEMMIAVNGPNLVHCDNLVQVKVEKSLF